MKINITKPDLKKLEDKIFTEKKQNEFEKARKILSTDRFQEFVKFKLAQRDKSN